MKIKILVGMLVILSLGITGCTKNNISDSSDKEIKNEQESEEKFLTEEEMIKAEEENKKNLEENIKYKFGKLVSIKELDLEVEFVETPDGYNDKGYSDNLDVDLSNQKTTGKKESVNLIGIESNVINLEDLEIGKYVRVGIYESGGSEHGFDDGMIMSLDLIDK